MEKELYAEILFNRPIEKSFTYKVPKQYQESIKPYVRVLASFGRTSFRKAPFEKAPFENKNKELMGYLIELHRRKPNYPCKEISQVLDLESFFDSNTLELARWISEYYFCSLGEALALWIPRETKEPKELKKKNSEKRTPKNSQKKSKTKHITESEEEDTEDTKTEEKIETDQEQKNILSGFQSAKTIEKTIRYESFLSLKAEQEYAVLRVEEAIQKKEFRPYLLYGVTGSGKTEVYKKLVAKVLERGLQALVLVPEIALTKQNIEQFEESFPSRVAVLHSKLNSRERYRNWLRIQKGELDVILGARSAVFCPARKLGVIIIDEEHEPSYKSSETPHYHARQIAYKRAMTEHIPLVLGSATPSLETLFYGQKSQKNEKPKEMQSTYAKSEGTSKKAKKEVKKEVKKETKIELLPLVQRYAKYPQQKITLVDMRKEKGHSFLSRTLFQSIAERLLKKEQIILFINKRGYAPILLCSICGFIPNCPNCAIVLSYHQVRGELLCHYCEFSSKRDPFCKNCNGKDLRLLGCGTERIEEEITASFETAKILRMDSDSTRKKGSHEKIISQFQKGELDILIGTQMLAKGLHFPKVSLVGVILADLSLHLPDFRSAERSFSLLTQISGRAGRGEEQGEVILQSYIPQHPVIQAIVQNDSARFYERELAQRKEFAYPPYTRLIRLVMRSKKEEVLTVSIQKLAQKLKQELEQSTEIKKEVQILGPSPAPILKINQNYRWQILLKGKKLQSLQTLARKSYQYSKTQSQIYLELDLDPISMM